MSLDERFEKELERRRPAPLPEGFKTRLFSARPPLQHSETRSIGKAAGGTSWHWLSLWRWVAPATVVLLAGVLTWHFALSHSGRKSTTPVLKADDVQITEQLVSSFDAVARLPSGEPVRFRYQKWMDEVVMKDRKRGVVIAQRAPRVEVIPVGFDTY